MRKLLKRLIRLSAGYSLVTLLVPLVTIFLTPLYTRVLEPSDYGVVDIATTITGLVSVITGLGMDQALSGYFFESDESRRRNLVTTAFLFALSSGIVAAACIFLLGKSLAILFFNDPSRQITFYFLALSLAFGPAYGVTVSALKLRMGVRRVNALGLIYLFTLISCNLVFVLGLQMKATGIIASNAIAMVIGCFTGIALSYRPFHGIFQVNLAQGLIKTGAGIMLSTIGLMLLANIDRLLLTQYVTPYELGLYSIANKLCLVGNIVIATAMSAWVPMAIEISNQPNATDQLARITEFFLTASIAIALIIGLFASEILLLFTRAPYVAAAPYVTVLMAYHAPIILCAGLFSIGLHAKKQTKWIAMAYAIATPANIGLNFLLNPFLGVWGAVWATVIAGAILAITTLIFCNHIFHVNYRWLRLISLFLVYLLLISVYFVFPAFQTLTYKLVSLLVFVMGIFAAGVISFEHIKIMWKSALHRSRTIHSTSS